MHDERSANRLPTWIPEALLIAEQQKREREAVQLPQAVSNRTSDGVSCVLDQASQTSPVPSPKDFRQSDAAKLGAIRESIRVSPQVGAEVVLSKMGFASEEIRRSAFFQKTVLDVWGGFSWLAPLVSRYWAKAVVVDPIFFESDVDACFEKDLDTIRRLVRDLQERIAKGDGGTSRIRNAMERNLSELEKVYVDMFFWKGYSPKWFPGISRIAAFAENLVGLPDGSQDFVFATNVVCKSTLDVEAFHKELLRVLSPDGHAYFLDYDDPSAIAKSAELEKLLRRTRRTHSFSDGWHRIIIS